MLFRVELVSLGNIDDHMPAPDGSSGIQSHDPWILEAWPLLTVPSMLTSINTSWNVSDVFYLLYMLLFNQYSSSPYPQWQYSLA